MTFTASLDDIVAENRSGLLGAHASWGRVRLGEVATILNGFPFPSSAFSGERGVPLLRIRDVLDDRTEAFFDGEVDPAFLVEPGNLIVGMDGDFNCARWKGPRAALNQRTCRISPDDRFYSLRVLALILPGYLTAIHEHTSSITVKHLSSRTLAEIPLPLPSRAEQDRIASELERYLSRIDAATGALRRVTLELDRYRASVLKAACEGHLVPTEADLAREAERQYEHGADLVKRIVRMREAEGSNRTPATRAGLALARQAPATDLRARPDGWAWTTLKEVAELKGGLTKGQKRKEGESTQPVPYLRVANVQRGWLDLDEVKTIEATAEEIRELRLSSGDVLFNEGGDRDKLGRGWIWESQIPTCIHQNHVFRARVPDRLIRSKFLSWYGNSVGMAYFTAEGRQTTNLASINLTKLGSLPVPVPPLAEQDRIVAEVERRLSIADEAQHAVSNAIQRTNAIRAGVLRRAFEGKLVPQDPSDEPASVLLERIRKEREAAGEFPGRGRNRHRRGGGAPAARRGQRA